ncbi:MAG: hypothetical protein VX910_02890 [Candidatus Latescibacterota bacterium]|nr:hypothetical protein [Candidatus Latescibacterota bacterium]
MASLDTHVPDIDSLVVTPDEADIFVQSLESAVVKNWAQYGRRTAYLITIGTAGKPHVYFTRPHAHEPAGTAACFEWIRRLCIVECNAWSSWVLENFRISFLADANPSGSQRAPVKFWDGSEIPNETFFLWMFGESGDKKGERFPRVSCWDIRDVIEPKRVGIAYEQIDPYVYVEPNRDHRSTFFRAYFDLNVREPVDVWLDLHQTEYVGSDRNAHINLPINVHDMIPELQAHYLALGECIHESWLAEGAAPRGQPQHPYTKNLQQSEFLNRVWSPITPHTLHLVTEVQNNNHRTSVENQVRFQMVAMDEALRYVESNEKPLAEALRASRRVSKEHS